MKGIVLPIMIIIYILCAAFTYGYVFNKEVALRNERHLNSVTNNETDAEPTALICGCVWPLYWPFHVSRMMWSNQLKEII
jgi:hypothetical protein